MSKRHRAGAEADRPAKASITLPVIEERASLEKETVETGRVRIGMREHTEPREVHARLERRHVAVERVAKDELLEQRPMPVREGDVHVFPVAEEVLVLETRWRLVEEVRVRAVDDFSEETIPVELRHQEVVVERGPPQGNGKSSG